MSEPAPSNQDPRGAHPDGAALVPGAKVGRYTLVALLGQGGMGTVYTAHDPELDRRVAIKVLHGPHPGATEMHARFVREARLMAKLVHPNIVTVFDAGEMPGGAYIVMELVEGTSLEGWLEEKVRPPAEILPKYLMAGYALAAAHGAGIVHRDFKPANVLLDRKGRVAVADFGIASVVESAEANPARVAAVDVTMTRAGVILGTPAFMSPEQFLGERADARTDQFSFAVALYESLFGEPPFRGETVQERSAEVLAGTPRPLPRETRERVPPGVYDALIRALSRKPADRFPTLLALLRAIERAIDRPSARRRPPLLIAAGVLGLATLAATTFFVVRRRAPSTGGGDAEHALVGLGGKCIDAGGDALELRTCSGASTQRWRFASGKLLASDGRCIGPRGGASERLATLELQPCNDDRAQAWQLRGGLLASGSGLCANVERNRTQDGTPIILFECNDRASNEHWRLDGKSGPR